jgi:gamma-butyrobetaine dioxygenase
VVDVVGLFAAGGGARYGESVTQLEHALQCAALARQARADDEVVLAALLHDVGHLAARTPEGPAGHHGHQGAGLLQPCVPPRVAWLIEHHVVAKRYLCTVDPRDAERLSPASVRIRRWDDAAKIAGAVCPPLAAYRPLIERWLGPQSWPAAAGIA